MTLLNRGHAPDPMRRRARPDGRGGRPPVVSPARTIAFVGTIVAVCGILLTIVGITVARLASADGRSPLVAGALAALAVASAIPLAMWLARDLVHLALFIILPPPSAPPELDLDGDLPASLATCVVYPVIVHGGADVDALLDTMVATREHGGAGPVAHVALVDFSDSPTSDGGHDAALRAEIEARLATANDGAFAADQHRPPLAALFRERRWNPVEQIWMGWERKRGKLMEFVDLVSDETDATSFTLDRPADRALVQQLRGIHFVITLDVGSRLAAGGVRRLIATAAHPANTPVLDEPTCSVVSGYGFVRPHQALNLAPSVFGLIMYSGPPAEPTPSFGQRILDHDVFFGQGLFHVDTVRTVLHGRIPENSVLSHDKIEAMHAGAVCQTKVVLVDQTPAEYLTFRQRMHRWIRGDWHLIPWIFVRGGGPDSPGRRSLSPLGRWLVVEDLLGWSNTVSALSLLVLGWLVAPPAAVGAWTAIVVGLLSQSVVIEPLNYLLRRQAPTPGVGWGQRFRAGLAARWPVAVGAARTEGLRALLWLVLLPDRALMTTDAIVRSLYRTAVSRRHVLQWTSFARAARDASAGSRAWWRELWRCPVVALVVAVLLAFFHPPALPWAAPLLVLWLFAPAVARWTRRPRLAP